MRVLYCDPSQSSATARAVVEFVYGECPGEPVRRVSLNDPRSETLLQAIHELVGQDLVDALVLVNRAQSFTLIRILATLYNALAYSRGWALYEVAAAQPFTDLVNQIGQAKIRLAPHYLKAPNITYAAQPRK